MKIILLGLFAVLLSFVGFHLGANSHGGTQFRQMHSASEAPATVSMRQNDFALCGQPFYDDVYALVRFSEEYGSDAEAFVEHIKDIPGQLIEIILKDPQVLASCVNFSVGLVGPHRNQKIILRIFIRNQRCQHVFS